MPQAKHIVSESGDTVCIPIFVPVNLIRHLIGQINPLCHNYAYDRELSTDTDIEASKEAFIALIGQLSMYENDCCAYLVNCFDNEEFTDALDQWLALNSTTINNLHKKINSYQWGQLTSANSDNCDDRRWAGIVRAIDKLNQNNIDFLQIASDQSSDAIGRLDDVLTGIPLVSAFVQTVGASGWLEFIQQSAGDFLDEYLARDTQTIRYELACEIFCNTSGCEMTIEAFYDAVASRLPTDILTLLGESAFDAISFFVVGGYSTDNYYWIMYAIQLIAYGVGSEWFNVDSVGINIEYLAGSNQPNNEHTLYCNNCGQFEDIVLNFDDLNPTYTENWNSNIRPPRTVSGGVTGNARFVESNGMPFSFEVIVDVPNTTVYSVEWAVRPQFTPGGRFVITYYYDDGSYEQVYNEIRYDLPTHTWAFFDHATQRDNVVGVGVYVTRGTSSYMAVRFDDIKVRLNP